MENLTAEELVEAANEQSVIIGNLTTEKLVLTGRVRARDAQIEALIAANAELEAALAAATAGTEADAPEAEAQ